MTVWAYRHVRIRGHGSMKRIVILGAGTAGTIMANRLRRLYARDLARNEASIIVIDEDDQHVYQPGLLFIPFGTYTPGQLIRGRRRQLHRAVVFQRAQVERVDTAANRVVLAAGRTVPYD